MWLGGLGLPRVLLSREKLIKLGVLACGELGSLLEKQKLEEVEKINRFSALFYIEVVLTLFTAFTVLFNSS